MKRIIYSEDIRPLSEFRANAAMLIEQVRTTKRPMIITQHGKSTAVILDVREYEALLEKLEILQDIRLAESHIEQGLGISHKEAQKHIRDRIKQHGE